MFFSFKKSFLNRHSETEIAELMCTLISITAPEHEYCNIGRSITLAVLVTDILVYQRDKEGLTLTEKEFERMLELDNLNAIANQNTINDSALKHRLKNYLLDIPNNFNNENKKFEKNERAIEVYEFFALKVRQVLPVIKLLNFENY